METLITLLIVGAFLYGSFLGLRAFVLLLLQREWKFAGFIVAFFGGAIVVGLTIGYLVSAVFKAID